MLKLDDAERDTLGADGYLMDAAASGLTIAAPEPQGLFYGLITAVQSLSADGLRTRRQGAGLRLLSHPQRDDRTSRAPICRLHTSRKLPNITLILSSTRSICISTTSVKTATSSSGWKATSRA